MSRRKFLWAAGVGAAASACSRAVPGQDPSTAPSTGLTSGTPTSRPAPVPPDWASLRARLGAGLSQPGSADFDTLRRSFNTLFDQRKPMAVAAVRTAEDVQACVEVARAAYLPIAARSGGHSYAGYSVPDSGLVVDLKAMSSVEVKGDGSAVIGAGARLIDVYTALAKAGRCLPGGSCPTVGIGGLTLGGGIGVLSRKFGLTCDKLRSAQVVTADGMLRTASAYSDDDLFWGLRGGGGGNFGIVTSFTFNTDPAPDLVVFTLTFPQGSAAEVVGAWQKWVAGAPDELWSNCVVSAGSPPKARVGGSFTGSPATLNQLLDTLVKSVRPISRTVGQRGYLDAMKYFGGCSTKSCTPTPPLREGFVASSRILGEPLRDPAGLEQLLSGRTGMDILLDSLGGAVGERKPADTAFPHRAALASAQIYRQATQESESEAAQSVAAVRDGLARLGATGGYVNYIEAAMPDWGVTYYGANLSRLRDVARKYDPDRVFNFAQSVHRA
ncbi:FAD-binding oxidoreductase [Alloactinosynnema sp. L-07]|uniref:FAD-binding oxidoreductase n=1 Tax=Alloactinosynnema sp. L-07 TaxID=1653480 RepID=UPI0006B5BFD2|nr:FAD-binding oxidoreductase [Alloactinosynnema sp. L-07]